jgi:hypothetical protein
MMLAHDKALFHEPIHQPYRAVMPDLQTLREFANRDAPARREALDGQ